MTEAPDTPLDSPLTMADALASPLYRDLATPRVAVGDAAFPFDLPTLDGERRVRLQDCAGRPVALVFGSYT